MIQKQALDFTGKIVEGTDSVPRDSSSEERAEEEERESEHAVKKSRRREILLPIVSANSNPRGLRKKREERVENNVTRRGYFCYFK